MKLSTPARSLAFTFVTAFSIAAGALGCHASSEGNSKETIAREGAPSPATTSTNTSTKKPEDAMSAARRLALSPSAGSSAVDTLILSSQKSLDTNPEKVDFWILLGRAWVRKARESADPGFYLNAKASADVARSIAPDNVAALNLEGLVLLSDHKFREALDIATRITTKAPDDPSGYGTLSDAYLELGRYDEAVAAAQKMVDLKPNLPSYSRVSYLAWLRGDRKAATEAVRLALDSGKDVRDPEPYAWVLVQAATLFLGAGDVEGADAGFDKALEWFPEFAPALVGKARVAFAKNDATKMAEYARRAYAKSPLVETAWIRGDAETMLGNAGAAAAAYATVEKEGRRTDPRTLASFFATKARTPAELAEAVALAKAELAVRPDIWSEDALAWALHKSGKSKDALALVEHARVLGVKDSRLLYHQGAIRIATGDAKGGRALLDSAMKLNRAFELTGSRELEALAAPERSGKTR